MQNNLLTILFIAVALFAAACTPSAPTNTSTATEIATETVAPTEATAGASEETTVPAVEAAPVETAKLNLNTVTSDELLATIPDFGNRMVREFEEYRPYVSIQQFRREIGKYVDEEQVAFYEEYVYVPVNVNDSDAATLMQIPGIDENAADAIIAARPFDSNAAFLSTVADIAPDVDGALAQGYLEAD